MKKKSSEIVILKQFKKTEEDILNNLSEILAVSLDSILPTLSDFLIGQPLFIPPITSILNPFIKGYASYRDFREFEMVVSFIDSAQSKSKTEKEKFTNRIENDPELIKKTLYYVSQQNDIFKSKLIGNLFKEYTNDKIDKKEFLSVLLMINRIDWGLILEFHIIIDNVLMSDDHYNYFYTTNKKKSWECMDIKWSTLNKETFGVNKNKFLSGGLINEDLLIQPISQVLGNYKEEDQVMRLREASQNVQINFNVSYEGFLILRFGNIKNIDENFSLG